MFGEVTLSARPARSFAFSSQAIWPEGENCDALVLDGILDVLIPFRLTPVLGGEFVLQAVRWHDVDSAPMGYYWAAKEATNRILHIDGRRWNIEWLAS
jgi:hypothetical protein